VKAVYNFWTNPLFHSGECFDISKMKQFNVKKLFVTHSGLPPHFTIQTSYWWLISPLPFFMEHEIFVWRYIAVLLMVTSSLTKSWLYLSNPSFSIALDEDASVTCTTLNAATFPSSVIMVLALWPGLSHLPSPIKLSSLSLLTALILKFFHLSGPCLPLETNIFSVYCNMWRTEELQIQKSCKLHEQCGKMYSH